MKELQKDCFFTQDDTEVVKIIDDLKKMGYSIIIDKANDNCLTVVIYEKGFTLYVISYYSKEGDNGYTAYKINNFISMGFNFMALQLSSSINVIDIFSQVQLQVQKIAGNLNLPYNISTKIDKNFLGLVSRVSNPLSEITNYDGRNN